MKDSDTFQSINKAFGVLLATYLPTKINTNVIVQALNDKPELISTIVGEIDEAIALYNSKRKSGLETYLPNSIELANIFKDDLPLFTEVTFTDELIRIIGIDLRDNSYFSEVWQSNDAMFLLCNILMLLYRTSILTLNSSLLVNPDGTRRVQISSALEEMIFLMHLNGRTTLCFQSFRKWLDNWDQEEFSEELFQLVQKAGQWNTLQ